MLVPQFSICVSMLFEDLTNMGLVVFHMNPLTMMSKIQSFCVDKLGIHDIWPIPLQICIVAQFILDYNDCWMDKSLDNLSKQKLKRNLLKCVVYTYDKYYQKSDYPRFYALLFGSNQQ